jgi:hypothetical protein
MEPFFTKGGPMRQAAWIATMVGVGWMSTACMGDVSIETPIETDSSTSDHGDDEALQALYQNAIEDAIFAQEDEIATDLIALTPEDPRLTWQGEGAQARVLMVTWTSYPGSYLAGSTTTNDWGDLWVTASPELKDYLSAEETFEPLRIAQLLGLPPETSHSHFAQLWVSPNDLFRPCPDREITDSVCDLEFPSNPDNWYVSWFERNLHESYFPPAYPWTRLGYTYDWAPETNARGLSEFVVRQGSSFVVESVSTTAEYLEQ